MQLDAPTNQRIRVRNEFRVAGRTDAAELMLSLHKVGLTANTAFAQQRLPVHAGRFDRYIWLPWGNGEYEVGLWRWDGKQKVFLQLASFRVVAVGADVSVNTPAPPALMWAFDPVREKIESPTRAAISADGAVPIQLRTNHQKLLVTVSKDGRVSQYVLPAFGGMVRSELWLSRGTGRYDITVWRPDGDSFVPWAAFAVNNRAAETISGIDEAPRWFDAVWQTGHAGLEMNGLQAMVGAETGIASGKLTLQGSSIFRNLVASVEKGGEKARYRIPVAANGKFSADVWLRFGSGVHTVTIWSDQSGKGDLQALVRFSARSGTTDDIRYRAPSFGIESDDPKLKALAAKIARPGTDAYTAARLIHDWVTNNVSYDVAKYRSGSFATDDGALKTLESLRGVCQDFAYLTIALLRAAGLEARMAIGSAQGYSYSNRSQWESHAWVEARVNGRWLVMDPTWDAGSITSEGRFVRQSTHTYFDPKPEVFARNHRLQSYDY